jgi:hypothetical protein
MKASKTTVQEYQAQLDQHEEAAFAYSNSLSKGEQQDLG